MFELFNFLLIILPLLIAVAFFTLFERKILAVVQRRQGPNVVGFYGLLQPLADGLKLFAKETIVPSNANIFLFYIAPIITFGFALSFWALLPFGNFSVFANLDLGLFLILSLSSVGIYGLLLAGWSSNSKYAILGALRSSAQMIAYEVSIGFYIGSILVISQSSNLLTIIHNQAAVINFFPLFPLVSLFFVSGLVETNRHPFDLPEAEAELVAGYNVEYSSMTFALFFLGEYANILFFCFLIVILFFGGWLNTFSPLLGYILFCLKISFFFLLFVLSRAGLPRYRYDQLMALGWKIFFPFSLSYLVFITSALSSFDFLPLNT